ncbi:TetR/AcrR family transcriptional regulator [Halocatena marina]|uniref:TetR/AcrR family transcriptional regulator n=1 Tax=Halocatena marina TaxID=2934937 RepID=A0ABD5YJQ0_9EURY|nr:TetR/AcrR family transcriptional regulator [Halocatena marina]
MNTETADEIIAATYRALCEHGYADLTMQCIADESSMTTAAIHYHFDTKKELLNAFLQHIIDQFEQQLPHDASDPRERLASFLTTIFTPASTREDDFPIALMELKAQAPYQEIYRERLHDMDEKMQAIVTSAVRDGIDAGYFDDADPEMVARFVVTSINGGHVREVALAEDPNETRQMIETYLELQLGWTPEVVA